MTYKQVQHLLTITRMETHLWNRGITRIAGADEAGRGPLAGPVVAACVVMPACPLVLGVNDSKKVSPKKREKLYDAIISAAIEYGVGVVSHKDVDDVNILNAAKKAFMLAAGEIKSMQYMLVDAITGVDFGCPTKSIIKGDTLSYSIAAASIIAKVTRDRMMMEYDEIYPQYGFAKHKGYGTSEHYAALREYGPCPIHRMTFLKNAKFIMQNAK